MAILGNLKLLVLDKYTILKGTVNISFKQLFKREIIDKGNDVWFIPDRALELRGKTLTRLN